jgi:hypothetical protein
MTDFTIVEKDGTESHYPSTVLYHSEHKEQEIRIEEKKEFYLAAVTMANAWLGCFAFWLPCLLYLSESGGLNVGGLFWLQTCLLWNFVVILKTYKELKKDLKK